jgi:hypothetical protein
MIIHDIIDSLDDSQRGINLSLLVSIELLKMFLKFLMDTSISEAPVNKNRYFTDKENLVHRVWNHVIEPDIEI